MRAAWRMSCTHASHRCAFSVRRLNDRPEREGERESDRESETALSKTVLRDRERVRERARERESTTQPVP